MVGRLRRADDLYRDRQHQLLALCEPDIRVDVSKICRSAVQLSGQNTYPDATVKVPLTYSLSADPTHGTITNFNASTGTFTYTPDPGYIGTDTFHTK